MEFSFPNETLVNEKNKNLISHIVFASGRKEICNNKAIPIIESPDDWTKVLITYNSKDVEGLECVGRIEAKSGWGGVAQGHGYNKAVEKLKKEAAKLGAGVVLLHGHTNELSSAGMSSAGFASSTRVDATAYRIPTINNPTINNNSSKIKYSDLSKEKHVICKGEEYEITNVKQNTVYLKQVGVKRPNLTFITFKINSFGELGIKESPNKWKIEDISIKE